ncbi:IS3 family transposase [Kytococcus sp. Marseille-QA3725]
MADAVLLNLLHDLQDTPEGLYGRRKMTAYLRRQGYDVGYGRVHRLMGIAGMNGVRRGRTVRTTIPAKDGIRAGDLLDRDFAAAAPDTKWVCDFPPQAGGAPTYVRTRAGFVYVAFVLDCFARGDRGLERLDVQDDPTGPDTPANGAVGARPVRHARPTRSAHLPRGRRLAVHQRPVHRAPRPGGDPPLDRDRGRCLRQLPDGVHDRPVQDRVHRHKRALHS